MSVLVLDRAQQREKLSLAIGAINEVSIGTKDSKGEFEKHLNAFLDHINDTKQLLNKRTYAVIAVMPNVSELSSLTDIDEELLADMRGLIDSLLRLNKVMIVFWAKVSRYFAKHSIAKTELKHYRQAADDVKELADDLNDRFFILPADKEFQELMQQLAAL